MRVLPSLMALALVGGVPAALAAQDTTMAMAAPADTTTPALEEAAVLAIFDGANRRDIETATIGIERSRDPRVRQLAVRFVNEHMAVRRQGQELGNQLSMVPARNADSAAMRVHGEVVQWLKAVPADSFDVIFLEHEVAYHAAVLEAIHGLLLPATTTPELRSLLEAVGPAFEAHLAAAQSLRNELTGMTDMAPADAMDPAALPAEPVEPDPAAPAEGDEGTNPR